MVNYSAPSRANAAPIRRSGVRAVLAPVNLRTPGHAEMRMLHTRVLMR